MRDLSLKQVMQDSIDCEGYKNADNTLEWAAETLFHEAIGCTKPILTRQQLVEEYVDALMGIPSYIGMPFKSYEIKNLMYALGYEKNEKLYWRLMAEILVAEVTPVARSVSGIK